MAKGMNERFANIPVDAAAATAVGMTDLGTADATAPKAMVTVTATWDATALGIYDDNMSTVIAEHQLLIDDVAALRTQLNALLAELRVGG